MDTLISIGISCYESIKIETVLCLLHAIEKLGDVKLHLNFRKGVYVHDNRNFIVDEALKAGATHLMFIDTDVTFEPDGIMKLLSANKDIIGGMYNMRSLPLTTTIKFIDDKGDFVKASADSIPKVPFRCYAVPTGFTLIRLECLKKIPKPYFEFSTWKGKLMGEDVRFCQKANEAGIEVWCDPTIRIGHIGEYLY